MDSTISLSTRSLQFYMIAKRWLSDVKFLRFEIDFLDSLLTTYYNEDLIYVDKNVFAGKLVALNQAKKDEIGIEALLIDQLWELELMADDILPEDTQVLTVKQIKLENLVKDFTNEIRQLKKDVYALVRLILKYKGPAF